MPASEVDYRALIDRALRGAVRELLAQVAVAGVPGGHAFYLTFRTGAPGVVLPPGLARQYPETMTIVLEHQFWDLEVAAEELAVTLAFDGARQRLVVPFDALVEFVDPEAQFMLRFGASEGQEPEEPAGEAEVAA